MKFLLKSYIKKIFQQRKYFIVFFLFIFFFFLLLSTGLAISSRLNGLGREIDNNRVDYQYQISYISRTPNESQQKEGISPFGIFTNNNYIEYTDSKNKSYKLSSIDLTDQDFFNLKDYINEGVDRLKNQTFNFLDYFKIKISPDYIDLLNQTKMVKSINDYFYSFFKYWTDKGENVSDEIIDKLLTVHDDKPVINISWNSNTDIQIDDSSLYEVGLNSIGEIIDANFKTTSDGQTNEQTLKLFAIGNEYKNNFLDISFDYDHSNSSSSDDAQIKYQSIPNTSLLSFTDEDLYSTTWFEDEPVAGVTNLDLYISYINEVAKLNNFNARYRNQMVYSDNNRDVKYVFVDRKINEFSNDGNGYTHLNSVNLNITNTIDHFANWDNSSVVLSKRFAVRNKYNVGDAFVFKNNKAEIVFDISGIGYDYNNSFPLIYDSDIIPNTKNEAMVYVNSGLFSNTKQILNDYVVDNSKIMFNYFGASIKDDANSLSQQLHLNPFDVTTNKKLTENNSITEKLRNHTMGYFANFFFIAIIILFVIFSIIGLTSIYVLISKDIATRLNMLGILKANGYKNTEIALEYGLKTLIPSAMSGIFGYIFLILFQFLVYMQLQTFFDVDIKVNLYINWYILIFVTINLVAFTFGFVSAYVKVKKPTVELMNASGNKSSGQLGLKIIDGLKIKSYGIRMMAKQFVISWKKVISLSVTMLISSFILSTLISLPVGVKNVTGNYYENQKINLQNNYQTYVVNNPLSYSSTYSDPESEDTFFPEYFKTTSGEMVETKSYDPTDSSHSDYLWDLFGLNFLYLKNKHFSIGALNNMIDLYKNSDGVDQSRLTTLLTQLINEIIPNFFGQQLQNQSSWEDSLSNMIISKMPPELLEFWNNENVRRQFSIDFQSNSFNPEEDELISQLENISDKNKFSLVGLEDNKMIKASLNKINNPNDVIASEAALNHLNINVGDEISAEYQVPELQILTNDGYQTLDSGLWKYNDHGKLIDLSETDLSKYTFANDFGENQIGEEMSYYKNAEGQLVPFYSAQNIELLLPYSLVANVNDWNVDGDNLFDNSVVQKDDLNKQFIIKPYNWMYSGEGTSVTNFTTLLTYITVNDQEPRTWYDAAVDVKNNSSGETLFKINNVTHETKYNIVSSVGVYDTNVFYTTKKNVNQLLNINEKFQDSWYNGKISTNEIYNDVFTRFGVGVTDGNISFSGLSNITSQISSSNFIGKKLTMFKDVYGFVFKVAIIFAIVVIAIIAISVSMVSNIFIEQFYKTINLFKVMGYKNSEINRMILGIYLPFNFIFIIIGSFIPLIIISIVLTVLAGSGILIPLDFLWYVALGITGCIVVLFLVIYFANYNSFIKLHINERLI